MEQNSFGHWLRLKRKALDLTREQLAERVGYSAATIRKIEDEERRPSAQIAERLAELFHIPADERTSFLQFARGDWRAAPTESTEAAPWMVSPHHGNEQQTDSQLHLATFLFTDIENSAKLWERVPEKMKVALARHHAMLQGAIVSNGGTVFQIIGDAFCAAFPTVLAATSAAVVAQQELQREQWDLPFPIRVRMGIHTGEAERTAKDEYASNPTLNRVARILNAAHGGQVLISLATKDLIKDSLPANMELRDMGEHYLKNLMYPEHLFQLKIAGLPSDFPPLNTLTRRHNLPVQLTSFIAREQEIDLIHEYLSKAEIRLVTLIGPPGIGKTRLSIESARGSFADFPDGVFFVALAPLEDPNLIASAVAHALGYVGARNISTTEQLKEGIGDKQMLLVLDNCEHLIEEVASLASQLLSSCQQLKIVATSRESLRIPGEWLYAVPAFDVPAERSALDIENASRYPALTLFAERARAVRADFSLTADNIETIASICARLDGLPLVIELMAARMRLMTPDTLLARLTSQFVLTADGMRAASERQKTLHHAIAWSYDLLSTEEKKLFAYLSVFSGGFTLDAAEALFSQKIIETNLPSLMALLLDKSLLKLAPDHETSGSTRYIMLVTIKEYAHGRLKEMGEEANIRNGHLAYFLDVAKKADRELRGHHQLEWLKRLDSDRDNLHAALEWATETEQTELALEMASALDWFWFVRSDHNEARRWLERVLALPGLSLYPGLHSEILTQLANHIWIQIGAEQARSYAESGLSLARAQADKHNTMKALTILGMVMLYENNFGAASSYLEESKMLAQELKDQWRFAHAMMCLGTQAHSQQDWAISLTLYKQVLKLFRDLGDGFFQAVALRFIGDLEMKQGNLAHAITALRESLILTQQLNSKYEIGHTLWRCAEAAQRSEKPALAVCLYCATKKVLDSIGAWTEGDELFLQNDLAPCQDALGESAFAQAVEEGQSMTMEQAIASALENRE